MPTPGWRGKTREGASFPVSPTRAGLPRDYAETLGAIKRLIQQERLVSQLPWGHIIRLLQRVKEPEVREWYIGESIKHGWSRSILELQIDGRAYQRHGKALTNFEATLPPADSDMAAQVFKNRREAPREPPGQPAVRGGDRGGDQPRGG